MLVEYDLNLIQGSTFGALLTATDENGAAIDLGTYQLRGSIKSKYSDSSSLVDLDLSKVPDGNSNPLTYTNGKINVSLAASTTSTLPITQAVYDIEMFNSAGYVAKLLDGRVNIHPEVTTGNDPT
jgi:hypothetical protein